MPGTTTWTGGANDGNWATAGNWTTSGGSTPPGAGDTVVINTTSQDITSGLATGISIANIYVTSGYGGKIGAPGTSLTTTAITGVFQYGGSGAYCYFGCSGTIAQLKCEHTGGTFYLTTGTLGTSGSAVAPQHINNTGALDIAAAVVTTGSFIENLGGTVTMAGAIAGPTINQCGGSLTVKDRTAVTINAIAGFTSLQVAAATTAITVYPGAVVNDTASGTATIVYVFPRGTYSLGGSTAQTKTITNISVHSGGVAKYLGIPGLTLVLTNPLVTYGSSASAPNPLP